MPQFIQPVGMVGMVMGDQHAVTAGDASFGIRAAIPVAEGIAQLVHQIRTGVQEHHLARRAQEDGSAAATVILGIVRPEMAPAPRR